MSKFIHLFSGGLDSTVLLYELLDQGHKVHCMTFDYRQQHGRRELQAARAMTTKLDVPHNIITMPQVYDRCALVGGKPLNSEEDAIVPNRNMILISIAAAYALEHGAAAVTWAANADDERIFPDCRYQTFLRPLNLALRACHTRRMEVYAPYLMEGISKRGIVEKGRQLGVPFNETWSCYKGGAEPCGECGACKLRHDAMQ